MYNTYDFKVTHPDIVKQLTVKDMLFVYYKCPQLDRIVNLFTHYNEIVYTLNGKKTLHHREKSWDLTDNKSLFIRRTAYNQEMYDSVGWDNNLGQARLTNKLQLTGIAASGASCFFQQRPPSQQKTRNLMRHRMTCC
jgi:hypothetical protein